MRNEALAPPGRRRNSLLAGLELFRALNGASLGLTHFLTFLYVCENEGLSITELAVVARLSTATASRSIRGLARKGSLSSLPPYAGLIEVRALGPQVNSRTLVLTDRGRELRSALEAIIREAAPVIESQGRFA